MSQVLVEVKENGVALVRLNRPAQLNALSMSVRAEMAEHINKLSADDNVSCLVITGDEKAFAAGADVVELERRTVLHEDFELSAVAWNALNACRKPIIAAVNGYALGGGFELALHCDIIIAGEGAILGQPEVRLGIMPGAGGVQRFLRATGKYGAMRWLLTGDRMSADIALRQGLVSEVVTDEDVLAHSLKLADKLANLPALAVAAIKESIQLGPDAPLNVALSLERKAFQILFASEDKKEGTKAFIEKRKPVYQGK